MNKKSQGGLRAEWKKKYLVLTQDELTYYPSFQDYMAMTHKKSFKLQHISVKALGQRVPSNISRTTATPPNNLSSTPPINVSSSNFTDNPSTVSSYTGNQSDRSNSQSPPPGGLTNSLDVSYNSNASSLRATGAGSDSSYQYGSHDLERSREYRSPLSPGIDEFGSSEHFEEELGSYKGPNSYSRYEGVVNGRGHTRNGSLDDNTMLKQLRMGGEWQHLWLGRDYDDLLV